VLAGDAYLDSAGAIVAGQLLKIFYSAGSERMLLREAMSIQAEGDAEVDTALLMTAKIARPSQRITRGADKAYDRNGFVKTVRALGVRPHASQNNKGWRSAIDGSTTRHEGYQMSLSKPSTPVDEDKDRITPDVHFSTSS
jgi:hypothetical protein